MNLLKSAFNFTKPDPTQRPLLKIYENVKSWDEQRAKLLGNNIHIIQLVMDKLDIKVMQVDKYIDGLQKLMSLRLEEITIYCKNGVNDSEFFVVPTPLNSLKPCHYMLKQLLMEQSQREQNLSKKATVLTTILEKLKKLKATQCSQSNDSSHRQGDTVRELKSNIRYLIDCQLPDLFADVMQTCKQVSSALPEEKDLYWAVQKYAKITQKQLKKHQQIGQELCNLSQTFSKREKRLKKQLKLILLEWVTEDLQEKVFQEQLSKNQSDQLIDDYYNMENQIPEQANLWKGGSLVSYLHNFSIPPIKEHEKLIVYSNHVIYNGKTQTKIILTQQAYIYLFRLQKHEPDFNFVAGKNIRIKAINSTNLQILQWKKTMFLRQEIQFKFTIQFNRESDLKDFVAILKPLGCQIES